MNTTSHFPIRAYTKKELALMYFPDASSPRTAVNHLMAWVNVTPEILDELQQTGYRKEQKYFTPRQVRALVEFLGEP